MRCVVLTDPHNNCHTHTHTQTHTHAHTQCLTHTHEIRYDIVLKYLYKPQTTVNGSRGGSRGNGSTRNALKPYEGRTGSARRSTTSHRAPGCLCNNIARPSIALIPAAVTPADLDTGGGSTATRLQSHIHHEQTNITNIANPFTDPPNISRHAWTV